jgi:hypothetical protein
MADYTTDENRKKFSSLSQYLCQKVLEWDTHFGPLTNEDLETAESEVGRFLLDLRQYCSAEEEEDGCD